MVGASLPRAFLPLESYFLCDVLFFAMKGLMRFAQLPCQAGYDIYPCNDMCKYNLLLENVIGHGHENRHDIL